MDTTAEKVALNANRTNRSARDSGDRVPNNLQNAQLRLATLNNRDTSLLNDVVLPSSSELDLNEIQRRLSPQEQRVLRYFLECLNDKAVARRAGTKLQTVRNQMASIERKLNAHGRVEVIIKVLAAYYAEKLANS